MPNNQFKNAFIYEESDEPEMYDDQYTLKANKNIYIQVSDKYIVHKWVEKEEACYHIGEFNSLDDAFKKAIEIDNQVVQRVD